MLFRSYLKIKCAVVPDENHKLVEKNENKSYAGRRIIEVPDYLKDILDSSEHSSERISPHSPNYIWKHFDRICEENGIPHFTIHSLRHANASSDRQVQGIAYSLDKGRTFTKYDKNPVINSKEKWNSQDRKSVV